MSHLQSASRVVIAIGFLFLLLLGFSLQYVEPGTGSYVVAHITLVPVLLSLIAAVAVLYTGWSPFE